VSGLKGLFDLDREARLVQPGDSYKVSVRFLRRHPPLKHHPTGTHHGEQVAIPGGLGRVGGQWAVRERLWTLAAPDPLRPQGDTEVATPPSSPLLEAPR
jgi:hypothetical protein